MSANGMIHHRLTNAYARKKFKGIGREENYW